jgi:hypothetical protein
VKLSRNEQRVLRLAYDKDNRITLEMVRALGLKTAGVPASLEQKNLLKREPFCGHHLRWKRTMHGDLVRRLLSSPRVCDWCDQRATDGGPIADSATHIYFCDNHEEVAYRAARGRKSLTDGNLANSVFGHQAVKKATREAATA